MDRPSAFTDHELRAPQLTPAEARAAALQLFGVDGPARELGSHQDQNFLIDAPTGRVILKIANPWFGEASLELQNRAMEHLQSKALPFETPRPLRALSGEEIEHVTAADGSRYPVRLVSYHEGEPLVAARHLAPAVAAALGAMAARSVAAFADFEHPAAERLLEWDLQRAPEVVEGLTPKIADRAMSALARATIARVEAELAPLVAALPRQIIHGDVTDYNVVARRDGAGRPLPAVLIDFGDCIRSWRVAELGVCCASFLEHDPELALQQTLAAARAFDAIVPLTDAELAALWPLVCARAAASACSTAVQAELDPHNAYATEIVASEWRVLEVAAAVDPVLAQAAIRAACGREPHPAAAARAAALQGSAVAPLDGLQERARAILDLGAESDDLRFADAIAPDGARRAAERAAARAPEALLVGRWGEGRIIHGTPGAPSEPATIHLGVDLIAPAGTTVLAPLDGRVLESAEGGLSLAAGGLTVILRGIAPTVAAGAAVTAGDAVGVVADPAADAALPAHLHLQLAAAEAAHAPPLAQASLADAWLALCPDPSPLLGFDAAAPRLDAAEALAARRRAVAGIQELYYADDPPAIERGFRHYLFDQQGRGYLDVVNNVAILGHAHPAIERAAARQLRLLNTNSRFLYGAMSRYAERLAALLPAELDTVLFVSSGSEADDLALRLVRSVTGRRDVACVLGAYHGITTATYEISSSLMDNPLGAAALPEWVRAVPQPNLYNGVYREDDPAAAARYIADAQGVIAAMTADGRPPAAFICEPLLGNSGGVELPEGWLAAVYAAVRAAGGLCIADEVQVGYGRLGRRFWAFEEQGVVPDVVTVAKATGNGHPVGAVITRRELAEAFAERSSFFSSVGGSPVSCAVGLAVLDVIEQEQLQANARRVGDRFSELLEPLVERHPIAGRLHGMGLYRGLELVRDAASRAPATAEAYAICERLRRLGVIVQPTGDHENVLKIKPPLTITSADAERFAAALGRVLDEGW